jgi:hypothetical protein
MTKTLTTRSLLLAGALAFAALPVLAQTAPSTQPAAPAAGGTIGTPATAPTGKSTTDTTKSATNTTKSHKHSKKIASHHARSKVHTVSAKQPVDSKVPSRSRNRSTFHARCGCGASGAAPFS